MVSITTPTSSLFSASRPVPFFSLAEKASRVFCASYFLQYYRPSRSTRLVHSLQLAEVEEGDEAPC
jgi:hypothetical protein